MHWYPDGASLLYVTIQQHLCVYREQTQYTSAVVYTTSVLTADSMYTVIHVIAGTALKQVAINQSESCGCTPYEDSSVRCYYYCMKNNDWYETNYIESTGASASS
jgi:hypothetical protein